MSPLSGETDAMLTVPIRIEDLQSGFYGKFMKKKKNRVVLYFCLGFILSTVFAAIAYGVSCAIWMANESDSSELTTPGRTIDEVNTISNVTTEGTTTISLPSTSIPTCSKRRLRRIVAYYSTDHGAAITRQQLSRLTHLILKPNIHLRNGTLTYVHDSDGKKFSRTVKKAREVTELKILFSFQSLEIYSPSFVEIIANSNKTSVFLNAILLFVRKYQLDGIDVNLRTVAVDSNNLIIFCKELKNSLDSLATSSKKTSSYVMSGVVVSSETPAKISRALEYLDFLTISTISYHYPSSSSEGHLVGPPSPLYSTLATRSNQNVDYTMRKFSCSTKQSSKLNMMVSFSGTYWNNVIILENPSKTLWMIAEPINGTIIREWIARSWP